MFHDAAGEKEKEDRYKEIPSCKNRYMCKNM